MRITFLFFSLVCSLFGQTVLRQATVPGYKLTIAAETRLEPAGPSTITVRPIGFVGNRTEVAFGEYLTDAARKTFFGYIIRATQPEGGFVLVTVQKLPLRSGYTDMDPKDWTSQNLDGGSITRKIVHMGDTVALDLLQNPQTGQRIVEYITLNPPGPQFHNPPEVPVHNLNVDDVELYVADARLSVNGKEELLDLLWPVAGKSLSIALKGKGRYVVSLTPDPGGSMIKAGEARGNTLSFKVGADNITVFSAGRIVPSSNALNLYVRFEPAPNTSQSTITPQSTLDIQMFR